MIFVVVFLACAIVWGLASVCWFFEANYFAAALAAMGAAFFMGVAGMISVNNRAPTDLVFGLFCLTLLLATLCRLAIKEDSRQKVWG